MKTEHPALGLLTDLIEDIKTESASQNVTEDMNIELLNVINEDVENVNKWSKMPPISDELYNELLKEFNTNSYYDEMSNYTLSQLLEEIKYTLDDEMLDEFITTIKEDSKD